MGKFLTSARGGLGEMERPPEVILVSHGTKGWVGGSLGGARDQKKEAEE